MSLFPAYANDICEQDPNILDKEITKKEYNYIEDERQLLASDSSESSGGNNSGGNNSDGYRDGDRNRKLAVPTHDFYCDYARDIGNLRVSTLYFPGRPQYSVSGFALGATTSFGRGKRRMLRYFDRASSKDSETSDAAEAVAVRTAHYQRLLLDQPQDEELWLDYIHFLERYGGGVGLGDTSRVALAAAEAACTRCPQSTAVRVRRLRLAQRALPADEYLALLRDLIATERRGSAACALWSALVEGVAMSAALCGAAAVRDASAAAVAATRHHSSAYPHLLYVYGAFLRSAGLWEQLILLLELVCAMNFPTPLATPPSPASEDRIAAERQLQLTEDQAVNSGLPLSAVWPRVERLRAAAHWRPAPAGDVLAADPQRSPLAADVADLLMPVTESAQLFTLSVHMLRLAGVPLLPSTGWSLRALHSAAPAPLWDAADAAALLPLLWEAARRSRRTHSAPSDACLRLLALVARSPHYFSDEHGFLSWIRALWASACGWFTGRERDALLCWRLRWHVALLALSTEPTAASNADGEAARVRRECRAALRASGASPLPCAEFARIEALVTGVERAIDVVLAALRAAYLQHEPAHNRIYIARVACEVSENTASSAGLWSLVSSVLDEPLPHWTVAGLHQPPSPALRERALLECERRCAELEVEVTHDSTADNDSCAALLPAPAEWAWARALLAPPSRLRELHAQLVRDAPPPEGVATWCAARRRLHEEASMALVWAAEGTDGAAALLYARSLLPYHPHNACLALLAGRAPTWVRGADAGASPTTALGALLPPLLSALSDGWAPHSARRLCAMARRVTSDESEAARAPLLWALRLEAETRVPPAQGERPRAPPVAALYRALDLAPHCKELYVMGAWVAPGETAALADLLLEKQLRLHALPEELHAL